MVYKTLIFIVNLTFPKAHLKIKAATQKAV